MSHHAAMLSIVIVLDSADGGPLGKVEILLTSLISLVIFLNFCSCVCLFRNLSNRGGFLR